MPNKTVLVTGAAGFIGYHLARALKERGDQVVGFDNFNDYYPTSLKRARAALLSKIGVPVIEGDICDAPHLNATIEKYKATHIAHLAAQAGVRYSLQNPQAYIKTNIEGFVNVLEACRHHRGIKLTYASSSSVYGVNDDVPFCVKDRTDSQASLYGATKKSNELLANTYHLLYGIPVTGLRYFTVYGPWGRPDMAYFTFSKAILESQPIKIFNHGDLKRDFTYIDDIIAGTLAAIDLGAKNEIFNLGNHQPINVRDFVTTLEEALGKTGQKIYLPMQKGDVKNTFADIEHSKKKLKFYPKTSLQEGLSKFVAWFHEWNTVKHL